MTAMLRSTRARLTTVLALVAAFALLMVGGAAAQSDESCYPVPAEGCEEPTEPEVTEPEETEPEVQPSVVETPNPAPEPTPDNQPQAEDDDEGEELASTGIESPVLGLIAVGLVGAGAAAVVAARRRETADA